MGTYSGAVVIEEITCVSCGAPVDPGARHCAYCGAPVATVRCAACFSMSAPTAAFCAGCGRSLGLEPLALPDSLACPRCSGRLSAFGGDPGRLYDCSSCGGQFVEHALLRDLLERREICGAAVPRRPLRSASQGEPVHYVPCPSCRVLMNRHNFGDTSGVIVDLCSKHGVWFDTGELPRVLEFVEEGGLSRARQRELAAPRREAPTSTIDETHRGPLLDDTLRSSTPRAWEGGYVDDAKEVVVTLLHEIGEWLERH